MLFLKHPDDIQKITIDWYSTIQSGVQYIVGSAWEIEKVFSNDSNSILSRVFGTDITDISAKIDLYQLADFDPTKHTNFNIDVGKEKLKYLDLFNGTWDEGHTSVCLQYGQLDSGYLIKNTITVQDGNLFSPEEKFSKSYFVKVYNK